MLRHMLGLTAFTLGGLQGVAHAASFPGGSEGGAPLNLEQGHPGQEPGASADIGNTSIQALTAGSGGVIYAGSFGMGIFRSADRGGSWSSANQGLTDPFVLCLTTGKDGDFVFWAFSLRPEHLFPLFEGKEIALLYDVLEDFTCRKRYLSDTDRSLWSEVT